MHLKITSTYTIPIHKPKRHTAVRTINYKNSSPNDNNSAPTVAEECGDLQIVSFWNKGTDCIVDARMKYTDLAS